MTDEQDLKPLLDNQRHQLDLVFDEGDGIDAKSLAILGANVAIIIFINQTASGLALWQYFLLYAPFALSLLLDVGTIWPRKYKGPGIDNDTLPYFLELETSALHLQLLANMQEILQHNNHYNKQRLRLCSSSIALTGLGFLVLLFIL